MKKTFWYSFYNSKNQKIVKSYFFIFLSSIVYTIGLQGFLQTSRIFPSGIGALASLPTFIFPSLISYVSLIYLAINIPLIIFFWKKNKIKFMKRTIFFLISQSLFGSLFLIPDVKNIFQNLLNISPKIDSEQWSIFILALIGSFLMGLAIAFSWKFGGSTGGTDIIAYYYLIKKKKSIGSLMFLISSIFVLVSFLITIIFDSMIQKRWLITLFSSSIYIFIVSLLVAFIYPKYKKVEVWISSEKIDLISQKLKEINYWHGWNIFDIKSGYYNKDKKSIQSVLFLLETREFIPLIESIDPNAFIVIRPIMRVVGHMSTNNLDDC